MAPRWSWDFEDEPRPRRSAPAPPPPGAAPRAAPAPAAGGGAGADASASARATQVRRRRAAALVSIVVALVVIVAVASGSHAAHKKAAAGAHRQAHVISHPVTDPENDQLGAVRSVLAFTPFVKEGGTRGRDVALSFDDGPGPYTPQVLAVLERLKVKATFFAIGKMLQYFSPATVREIEDGDVIGDHTETHPMLAHLSPHQQYEELFEQIARIELLGGRRPTLFRPPYGSFDNATLRQLAKLHLLMTLWSVDTDDYQQPGVSVIVERALEGAHPGAIILLHDGGGVRTQTIEALPLIVKGLRAKGYDIVTVPKLLLDDPPPAGQPIPPNLSGD
jgi:peptidoglycan/xylan/chitin deacetylase (PgdA/CDA1 family)